MPHKKVLKPPAKSGPGEKRISKKIVARLHHFFPWLVMCKECDPLRHSCDKLGTLFW
jgi:hypothetical protein